MPGSSITKAERQELRGVVRNQFRVLRKEVQQRQAELIAEGEQQILDHFRAADEERATIDEQAEQITQEALVRLRDLCKSRPDAGIPRRLSLNGYLIQWAPDRRGELRAALYSDLDAKTRGALLSLDRQEADLLRQLAVDALDSDAAHAFLGSIPSVAELVPAARLAELEAQFEPGD